MNLHDVTILIPTYKRAQYLERLLHYLRRPHAVARIHVLDSSPEEVASPPIADLDPLVTYRRYPSHVLPMHKLADGLRHVDTTYVVVNADDDFIIPDALRRCAQFLDEHEDYSVAHGLYVGHYVLENPAATERRFIWFATSLHNAPVEDATPAARLINHLSHYRWSTFYAVHRTALMRTIFDETAKYTDDVRFGEILPTALTAVHGKIAVLPIVYCSRQIDAASGGHYMDPWTALAHLDSFGAKRLRVAECITHHLMQGGMAEQSAREAASFALDSYLQTAILLTSPARAWAQRWALLRMHVFRAISSLLIAPPGSASGQEIARIRDLVVKKG